MRFMLADYLESSSGELRILKAKLDELNKKYHSFYDRNLKQEIEIVKKAMSIKNIEVRETLYANLYELNLLREYFQTCLCCCARMRGLARL